MGGDGRNMHDTPLTTGKHRVAEGLGAQQIAAEVDRQHLVPLLQGQRFKRPRAQYAGVVDQYIATPVQRLHLSGNLVDTAWVGDVAAQRADLPDTVLAQGGCQLTALVQIAVQQHHMGLLLDQRCGQRRTNAAGRAGHHANG
ncbi:hypothetical protein D3C81_1778560 [compost metagenome]